MRIALLVGMMGLVHRHFWLFVITIFISQSTALFSSCVDPVEYQRRGEELLERFHSAELVAEEIERLDSTDSAASELKEALTNVGSRYPTLDLLEKALFLRPDLAERLDEFLSQFYGNLDPKSFWDLHLRVQISDLRVLTEYIRLGGPLPAPGQEVFSRLNADTKGLAFHGGKSFFSSNTLTQGQMKDLRQHFYKSDTVRVSNADRSWILKGFVQSKADSKITHFLALDPQDSEAKVQKLELASEAWFQFAARSRLKWEFQSSTDSSNPVVWIFYPD